MLISISDLKLHQHCPQKFHYQFSAHKGVREFSEALELGKVVHEVFALKLGGAAPESYNQMTMDALRERIDLTDEEKETVWGLYETLQPHVDSWVCPPGWKILGVEKEMRIPVLEHELVGRLDALVEWNGMFWHLQHKTLASSVPTAVFAELTRTDWHEVAYQTMAETAGHTPFAGTILNIIRKLSKKAMDAGQNPFEVHYLPRTRIQVTKALKDIAERVLDIAGEMEGLRTIEMTRTSCGGMFRNRLCVYKNVCDGVTTLDDPRYITIEPRYAEE